MITINLLTEGANQYFIALRGLQEMATGQAGPFSPDSFLLEAQSYRDVLDAMDMPVARFSRMVTLFEDLAADNRLNAPRAVEVMNQVRTDRNHSLVPGYDDLEQVGEGGFGTVYRAIRQGADKNDYVAIKVGHVGDTWSSSRFSRGVDRLGTTFQEEWDALSRFDSDHIVRVFDRGTTSSGKPYIVMEYLPGGSLAELAGRVEMNEFPFRLDRALSLAIQATEAVAHLHERGYLHNDIKLGNFLLSRKREVKLADFSFAISIVDARARGAQGLRGTPGHISIESIEAPQKDVFALGAALFQLFTGRRAFNPANPIATLLFAPPPPSQLRPERKIPPEIDKVILKAIQRAPNRRYADAGAVLKALRKVRLGSV